MKYISRMKILLKIGELPKKYIFTRSSLKKLLLGLGIVLFLFIAFMIGSFIYMFSIGKDLDKTSRDYVNESISAISTDWNVKEMKKRASSEFMSYTNDEELAKFFEYAEKNLGKMKVYIGAQGESRVFFYNFRKDIKASYVANAEFEKGKASIDISLIWKNNKWQILGYKVNSEVFKPY